MSAVRDRTQPLGHDGVQGKHDQSIMGQDDDRRMTVACESTRAETGRIARDTIGVRRSICALLVIMAVIGGCDSSSRTSGSSVAPKRVERDSSGIRLIDYELAEYVSAHASRWSRDEPAELEIGGSPDDTDGHGLFRVTGAAFLDGRRLAVGLATEPEIRLYDSLGIFVRRIGRRGSGPAELRHLAGPWRVDGGHFSTFDLRLQRLSIFDTVGRAVAGTNVAPSVDDLGMLARAVAGDSAGRILVSFIASDALVGGLSRQATSYALLDSAGTVAKVLGPIDGREVFVGKGGLDGTRALGVPPFGRAPLASMCGGVIAVADNGEFRIEFRSSAGELLRVIRADLYPNALDDADLRAFVKAQVGTGITVTEQMLDGLREMSPHATFPVLGQLLCDVHGNLFVERFLEPRARTRTVIAFGPEGELRGVFEVPSSHRMLAVLDDMVAFVVMDDQGIESVEIRRLLSH